MLPAPDPKRPEPTPDHRAALDAETADGERWETLAGHLYDPAYETEICPDDEMAEVLARRYAFTSEGRLFYLRKDGGVSERTPSHGQYNLSVDGERWQPRVTALMRRIFPGELVGEYDLDEYDLGDEDDDEWLEGLRAKEQPHYPHIKHRRLF